MPPRSSALRELAERASSLAKQCAKINTEPGAWGVIEWEKGKLFCQRAGTWIEDVFRDKEFGQIARERMNWSVREMQNGEAGRLYSLLYGLLEEGNDLIEERAARVSIAPRWRIINDRRKSPPEFDSVDEYAKARRVEVADALADPFTQLVYVNQEAVCDAATEPFSRRVMTKLAEAQLTLKFALIGMQDAGAVNFEEVRRFLVLDPTATGSARTEWQRLWQHFERVWITAEASEAAPWIWLGLNLCCFSVPPRFDVFDGVPEMRQKSLWWVATSGGGGPIPPFVFAVRDALERAAEQMEESKLLQEKPARSKPRKRDGKRWSKGVTREIKAALILDVLKNNPNMTDAELAKQMNVSSRTIQSWRADPIIGKAWRAIGGEVPAGFVDCGKEGDIVLEAVDPNSPGQSKLRSGQARKTKPKKT